MANIIITAAVRTMQLTIRARLGTMHLPIKAQLGIMHIVITPHIIITRTVTVIVIRISREATAKNVMNVVCGGTQTILRVAGSAGSAGPAILRRHHCSEMHFRLARVFCMITRVRRD